MPMRPVAFESRYTVRPDGCWQWTGYITDRGYGIYCTNNQRIRAHRWSYERHVGLIPEGLVVDHLCRNRACVNPDHLELVTNGENVRRGHAGWHMREKSRQAVDR